MSQKGAVIAEAAYAAINSGDLQAFLALLDPAVEFRSLVAESEDNAFRGHEGAREWWDSIRGAFEGMRFDVEEIQPVGENAGVSRVRVVAHIGDAEVPQTMWQAWRVRDGLVTWWETFRTHAEALEAVGVRQ